MMSNEVFTDLKHLLSTYCFVNGFIDFGEGEHGSIGIIGVPSEGIVQADGVYDEDLFNESMMNSEIPKQAGGHYYFEALFLYNKAQIGDYPPPNIEMQAHLELEKIEFTLIATKEQIDAQQKEESEPTDDLPF